ncbi:hypothetical protein KGM_204454 [Danaus plexippus plexippus]|uniref:Uncharacterized protein n=1 Tax=Danaus plexippus plexippus TaxID=278856 RepID=A0A212EUS4_DANPL|nr:hypothetical protein KGM_204454 [Danaus plexippus plexippus]
MKHARRSPAASLQPNYVRRDIDRSQTNFCVKPNDEMTNEINRPLPHDTRTITSSSVLVFRVVHQMFVHVQQVVSIKNAGRRSGTVGAAADWHTPGSRTQANTHHLPPTPETYNLEAGPRGDLGPIHLVVLD